MKGLLKKVVSSIMAAAIMLSVPSCIMADNTDSTNSTDIGTMTAQEIVTDMKIGWNLGNALDSHGFGTYTTATAAETYWSNPVTTKAMIDTVKAAGFNTVRVPVTWYDRLNNGTIEPTWLARVKEVVDYCYANNMYVIINLHHEDSVIIPDSSHRESSENHIKNLWSQIAPYFKDYDRHLIFETLNEPRIIGSGEEWSTGAYETREIISEYNAVAVNTIRQTGGNNATRLIMCPSNAAKIPASSGFTLPDDSNIALSVHNYSPYNFAMNADTSLNTWGSNSDKTALDSELKDLYNRYVSKGVPVVIGEMGATNKNNLSDRETWAKYYINKAKSYGITCVVWDNNKSGVGEEQFGLLNRSNCTWYFPTLVQAFMSGLDNVETVTPSTSDNSAYTTDLYTGSSTASDWEKPVVLDDVPNLTEGSVIEIEYSASKTPILCLQNYNISGSWTEISADKAENGVATYNYSSIVSALAKNNLTITDCNQLLVMSSGTETTVTRISVVYPHKTLDANNDGKENTADAAYILKVVGQDAVLTDTQKKYADVNCDSLVTVIDAVYVLKNLAI